MSKTPMHTIEEIHQACREMGLTPLELGEPARFYERYAGYSWYKIPFWRVKWVLYAVPAKDHLGDQPWESFYIEPTGEESHHTHYAFRIHEDDQVWQQNEITDDRPDEIIGRPWYWFDPHSMTPALLEA